MNANDVPPSSAHPMPSTYYELFMTTIKDLSDLEIKSTLDKINETQKLIKQSLYPNLIGIDHINAIQAQSNLAANLGIAEIIRAAQLPTAYSHLSETINSIKLKENKLTNQFINATSSIEGLLKQNSLTSALCDQIFKDYLGSNAALEMVRKQSVIFDDLTSRVAAMDAVKFSIPQLSQATLAWNMASSSLTSRMKDIGLLTQREMFSARLLEAPNAYADFVRHTTALLDDNPTLDIAARLRGSLNLAEYQLLEIADTFNYFSVVPQDDEEPDSKRILNVPFAQQKELLNYEYAGNESDTVALTNASPTAQTEKLARRVLTLVMQCNEAGKTSGISDDIFKPTTRMMTVYVDLPWLSATDKWRFGDLIDCLYFIFYEGAGKHSLRFLEENGGPLTIADCDLIWCIKHLRNKWLRHDADHGNKKDIQKSWAELSKKLQWLGLANYPTNEDFPRLHYKLLELAEEFLLCILNRLKIK